MANAAKLRENGMVNLDCEFGQRVWDPYTAPFVKDWDIVGVQLPPISIRAEPRSAS